MPRHGRKSSIPHSYDNVMQKIGERKEFRDCQLRPDLVVIFRNRS